MPSISNDNGTLSPDLDDEDVFSEEKKNLLSLISNKPSFLPKKVKVCLVKSAEKSVKYRKKGNELYVQKLHQPSLHNEALKMYIKCIAFAPNNSPELALGYGNRSALLFHVKKYVECVEDCDRAISIGTTCNLEVRLLCRKAESLLLLNKPVIDVCNDILRKIQTLTLEEKTRNGYIIKIGKILIAGYAKKIENVPNTMNYQDKLLSFPRSKQIPCASNSITVKYNSEWGKHIVATNHIEPGDIISVEKYLALPDEDGTYSLCSYCINNVLNMIPCENCVYALYCSESCRKNAWEKYHQFECPIIHALQSMGKGLYDNVIFLTMKIVLSAVEEAGSIERLKDKVVNAMKCNDPKLLKFPKDIFDSVNTVISILKIQDPSNTYFVDHYESMIEICCSIVYLLNKNTNFFGKNENISMKELFSNDDKLFIASLLLKVFRLIFKYGDDISFLYNHCTMAYGLPIFKNFFNHSCYANVQVVEADTLYILIAQHPIKKGEQLFISFSVEYAYFIPKEDRQEGLMLYFNIKCKCIACTENWSDICAPSLEEIVKTTPALEKTWSKVKFIEHFSEDNNQVFKILNDVIYNMKIISKEITTLCDVYYGYETLIENSLRMIFCSFSIEIPDDCSGEEEFIKAVSCVKIS